MEDYRKKAIERLEVVVNKLYDDDYCMNETTKKRLYDSACEHVRAYQEIGLLTLQETTDYIVRLAGQLFK